ncbi:MAG: hypothetical protein Q4D65_11060, partial [Peptostreptococcaceae bacterium]|nr:hypothetical protein [Peptostreptococcaceae bacterium]
MMELNRIFIPKFVFSAQKVGRPLTYCADLIVWLSMMVKNDIFGRFWAKKSVDEYSNFDLEKEF